MKRGEVWWYEHPNQKRRPVAILTRDAALGRLHSVLVAPATSMIRGIETEVELDERDGMRRPCTLNLDNTFLAPKEYLVTRITRLEPVRLTEACQALSRAAGCG